MYFFLLWILLVHRTRSDWVSAKNSREISINIAVTICSILYWIKTAGLMDSRWLWISIKLLIQFSDYNGLISVQTIMPKLREIEGNLKKRYAKLASQIWLGPCHWIKTQSDIACISWFPYDMHKNCYCYIWVICLILRRELRVTGDETQTTMGGKKEAKRCLVCFLLPSLHCANERKTSRYKKGSSYLLSSFCKHNKKLSRGSLLPGLAVLI